MRERKGYKPIKMTTHEQDKQLVGLALGGDQKSYNTLLAKYKPILYTAAKRRLPGASVEDLEDVVMIVLGQSFVKLNLYNPDKSKFFTWMVACLHNYVNSIPNQKKRVKAYSIEDYYPTDGDEVVEYEIPDYDNFSENYDSKQSFALLKVLMKRLPVEIYKVMYLKFFKDYTNDEIAEALQINKSDIWYKVKRGRELLKRYSDNQGIF
jgi:RNA polymerase sigma factor (sigma-70 family)